MTMLRVLDEYRGYVLAGGVVADNPGLTSQDVDQMLRELPTAAAARQREIIDAIVMSYQPLAKKLVRIHGGRLLGGRQPTGALSNEDLQQEATLGLIDAIEHFDPSRGMHFGTYAQWWIKTRINRAISTEVTGRVSGLARGARRTQQVQPGEDESFEEMQSRLAFHAGAMSRVSAEEDIDAKRVAEAIERLPVIERFAVKAWLEGHTTYKIADMLGIDHRAVSNTVNAGLEKIQTMLTKGAAYRRWGPRELAFLKRSYQHTTPTEMAQLLGLSRGAVSAQLHKRGMTRTEPLPRELAAAERDRFIVDNYEMMTNTEMAEKLGVPPAFVHDRVYKLGLQRETRMQHRDTSIDQFIRDNYETMTNTEIAAAIGRPREYVDNRLYQLGLKRAQRMREHSVWSAEMDRILEENYASMTDTQIASRFGLTSRAVTNRRHKLGLIK